MPTNPNWKVAAASQGQIKTAGAGAPAFDEVHERDLQERIAMLEALVSRYETAIDNIPQGVCFFDADERLILRNRRYCEIYRIAPERVLPGATLSEIMALRIAAGTAPSAVDAFFAQARATRAQAAPGTWTGRIADGRTIQICQWPTPDGGWLAAHDDITDLNSACPMARGQAAQVRSGSTPDGGWGPIHAGIAGFEAACPIENQYLSLQALIDQTPDYLWVKDTESRFVIANMALASDSGVANPADMIGLTDFDIHPAERARGFRDAELTILRTGEPMIEKEELIVNSSGDKKWILTTKTPLRNERNEIYGLVGFSRDITEVKAGRAAADEVLSLQALIDLLPYNLWVKDADSRFVICNKVTASRMGFAAPAEIIGKTDLELLSPDIANKFFADEQAIIRSGQPLIDKEECVFGDSGERTWILTTKVPLRNNRNEVVGVVGISRDITELKAGRAAADDRLSLQALIDSLPDKLWVKDADSRFVICNKFTASKHGFAKPADLIGKTDFQLHPPDVAAKFFAQEQAIVRSGQPLIDTEECVLGASGQRTWVLTTKVPLRNNRSEVIGVVGISRDITQRRMADALRDGQAQILEMIARSAPLAEVLDHLMRHVESLLIGISGAVLLLDKAGLCLRRAAAPSLAETFTGAIDGVRIGPGVGPCGAAAQERQPVIVADVLDDPLWADFRPLAAAHGLRSCWSNPILSYDGAVLGVVAFYSATARLPTQVETGLIVIATRLAGIAIERREAEDRIQFMANHDALTGLPNRALLKDRLSQVLLYAERYRRSATVAFIDLDNFKLINDSLGHNAGDELLKIVASRMVECVRATDTVVRLGGDEFVVLFLDQPESADLISAMMRKLAAAVAEPIRLGGHELTVTCSIGIANYPDDGADADTLLANADAAMYRAKEIGRDNFQFYTPELNTKVHEKFLLQEELRDAPSLVPSSSCSISRRSTCGPGASSRSRR